MRCRACDKQVQPENLDIKTGFYYCFECFSYTVEEQLRKDRTDLLKSHDDWSDLPLLDILPTDDTYEEYNLPSEEYYEEDKEGYNG